VVVIGKQPRGAGKELQGNIRSADKTTGQENMSQISISSVTSGTELDAGATVNSGQGNQSVSRAASSAVRQLNSAGYAGEGREVTFSLDPATRIPVIKVIDSSTKEVIRQLPQEYLLEIAAENTARK
jgi:flagellar protein FlaG